MNLLLFTIQFTNIKVFCLKILYDNTCIFIKFKTQFEGVFVFYLFLLFFLCKKEVKGVFLTLNKHQSRKYKLHQMYTIIIKLSIAVDLHMKLLERNRLRYISFILFLLYYINNNHFCSFILNHLINVGY